MEANNSLNKTQHYEIEKKQEITLNSFAQKKKKTKKKDKKRKYSSSSDKSQDESPAKKLKHKQKKKCKKRHKHTKDKKSTLNKDSEKVKRTERDKEALIGPGIPNELLKKAQSMAPMSKEEWEKRQSKITRVYDEESGRTRLIRGEGEIIEEIVTRQQHQEINRNSTKADGDFFQSKIKKWI